MRAYVSELKMHTCKKCVRCLCMRVCVSELSVYTCKKCVCSLSAQPSLDALQSCRASTLLHCYRMFRNIGHHVSFSVRATTTHLLLDLLPGTLDMTASGTCPCCGLAGSCACLCGLAGSFACLCGQNMHVCMHMSFHEQLCVRVCILCCLVCWHARAQVSVSACQNVLIHVPVCVWAVMTHIHVLATARHASHTCTGAAVSVLGP